MIDLSLARPRWRREAGATASIPLWKRILDIGLTVLTSPGWVPICVLIALYIKCVSRGPVLFRQERVGFRCRPFRLYKFRSMRTGADPTTHQEHVDRLIARDAPMAKMDEAGDARLIPLGRLFRATGLDELPQLWNVLRGEMSLVGPRPCTRHEFDRYESWQKARFNAPPGLTGLWQVSGKNRTTFTQMIELDTRYATSASLLLDLRILLRTLPAMLAQCRELRAGVGCSGRPASPDERAVPGAPVLQPLSWPVPVSLSTGSPARPNPWDPSE